MVVTGEYKKKRVGRRANGPKFEPLGELPSVQLLLTLMASMSF